MSITELTAHADQGAWATIAADAVLLAAEHPMAASDLAALAVQAAMACCPHGRPAASDTVLAHDLARALEAVAASVTSTLDLTAPGWGHLVGRVAELQTAYDTALVRVQRLERALADGRTVAASAQRVAAALGCELCGDSAPVHHPDIGVVHGAEWGRRGPNDPESAGGWVDCVAADIWRDLELMTGKTATPVTLVVLPEPDYEGMVKT